ncbi:MAG: EpsG family protein [Providencia rettgeri]
MELYILFFLILLFLALTSILAINLDNTCYIISSFVAMIFIGGRFNVGADFTEYDYIYNNVEKINFDFAFEFFFQLFRGIGFSYGLASFSFFLITLILLSISINSYKYKTITLFFFILYFIIPITSTIRQGLSLPFYLLAINHLFSFKKYMFFSITGALFHISNLIMVPFYFLKNLKLNKKKIISLLLFSFLLGQYEIINLVISTFEYFLSFGSSSANKILTYSTRYNEPMSYISQLYRTGGILFIFIFCLDLNKNEKLNFCQNIYFITFCLTLVFKDNGVLINRLSFSTNISLLYIAANFNIINKNKMVKNLILAFFLSYFSVNYFKFISTDLRYNVESAYLPYRNFFFE